jgi:hypothetical protein
MCRYTQRRQPYPRVLQKRLQEGEPQQDPQKAPGGFLLQWPTTKLSLFCGCSSAVSWHLHRLWWCRQPNLMPLGVMLPFFVQVGDVFEQVEKKAETLAKVGQQQDTSSCTLLAFHVCVGV